MDLAIYHNPRCSKSRETLRILTDLGHEPEIINYLTEPPSATDILRLASLLGIAVAELLRVNEEDFKSADDLPSIHDDDALAAWLSRHPRVLQRPIVVRGDSGRAVIGRPPEKVLELLEA